MYHITRTTYASGDLRKAVVVSKRHFRHPVAPGIVETLPGESRLISPLAIVKLRLWPGFPARWLAEMLFDRYASSRLSGPPGVVITTPRLAWTAARARALGHASVLYGGSFHPRDLWGAVQAERSTHGLGDVGGNWSRARELARFDRQLENTDYILAVSEFVKESYVRRGFPEERVFVTPLGVDFERFRPAPVPEGGPLTFLFLSHVNGAGGLLKGVHYLLRAWAELSPANARLVVSGAMGREAQALIRPLQERLRNVTFTGSVRDTERSYRECSVFVFPCLAGTPGKVNLEAMAVGRPVIDVVSPKPLVRDGIEGFTVPPRDVAALKEKIRYFCEHPGEASRMGENARERVGTLTWERFGEQVAEIVRELSERHTRAA